MKLIRWVLGLLILSADYITRPKPIVRDLHKQKEIDDLTSGMALYQFKACPFCVKVRRHMRKYALNIELRDAKNDQKSKHELIVEGGKHKVPCLRIDDKQNTTWLYSSNDICAFLDKKLGISEQT